MSQVVMWMEAQYWHVKTLRLEEKDEPSGHVDGGPVLACENTEGADGDVRWPGDRGDTKPPVGLSVFTYRK